MMTHQKDSQQGETKTTKGPQSRQGIGTRTSSLKTLKNSDDFSAISDLCSPDFFDTSLIRSIGTNCKPLKRLTIR